MIRLLLRGIPFLFHFFVVAGEPGLGVRSTTLGGATTSLEGSSWSATHNPALLGLLSNPPHLSAFVVPHRFGLHELRTVAFAGTASLRAGGVGIVAERFGFDLYNETVLAIGYGASFSEDISVGLTLTGKFFSIKKYGSAWIPLVSLGLASKSLPGLLMGARIENVLSARVGRIRERLPMVLSWGAAWTSNDFALLCLEIEKDVRYPATIRVGIEREFVEVLAIRGGYSSEPRLLRGGGSLTVFGIEFGYAAVYHMELGWTHCLEVAWEVGR